MGLRVDGLTVGHGGHAIVDGVTMAIGDGERVGLIGSSGSGKSMIARSIAGLLPDTFTVAGSVTMDGQPLLGLSDADMAQLRGAAIGMVFQNPRSALNPVLTVGQQIALPLKLHYDLTKTERSERVAAMLQRVGLDAALASRPVLALSGGQQQRVAIATALVTSPRLIIADEPTTALDSTTQRQIVDLLVSLVDGLGASMLFITHDFSVLAHATTATYVLQRGHIVEHGATSALLERPESAAARELVDAARALTLTR